MYKVNTYKVYLLEEKINKVYLLEFEKKDIRGFYNWYSSAFLSTLAWESWMSNLEAFPGFGMSHVFDIPLQADFENL